MRVGDLCWVFEGCKKVLEEPVIYMGRMPFGYDDQAVACHLAVLQHDGKQRQFADYLYTFVRVEDKHIL